MKISYHQLSVEEVITALNTNSFNGLNPDQAEERLVRYGKNELKQQHKKSLFRLVMEQFSDHLVQILLVAAAISFGFSYWETRGTERTWIDFVEPFVILVILLVNALVGISQESNAENALNALKKYSPQFTIVIRNGGMSQRIPSTDLVPGDLVELCAGDQVSADGRLVEINSPSFKVDESSLTGESNPVLKQTFPLPKSPTSTIIQEQSNMVFSGTICTSGKARFVVTETGMQTAIGVIHSTMQQIEEESSPLKEKLDEFGASLSKIISLICLVVWLVNVRHFGDAVHGSLLQGAIHYFKVAIALAVAAIPEGLAVIITTCLALGTKRMAKRNAIVRKLSSVETLGCTTVICSDKTGTITCNKMSVCRFACFDGESATSLKEFIIEGTGYNPFGLVQDALSEQPISCICNSNLAVWYSAAVCSLCNFAKVQFVSRQTKREDSKFSIIGEPTEAALKVFVERLETNDVQFNKRLKQMEMTERTDAVNRFIHEKFSLKATLEFTRERKTMSVLVSGEQEKEDFLFVKGAPEVILLQCTHCMLEDGSIVLFSAVLKQLVINQVAHYSQDLALRILALAMKRKPPTISIMRSLSDYDRYKEFESELVFLGIAAMHDAPRDGVKQSIQQCKDAGIRVLMITGDSQGTAEAISKAVGLVDEHEPLEEASFTGQYFGSLTEQEQVRLLGKAKIFSRVEPAHKTRIVSLLRSQNHVVAMTGDGINDAPALKLAHIGIGMGSGTDVARLASDIVLADDNFTTLVYAIQEGRAIYANTKQFIRYLISSNIGEVVCIFLGSLFGFPEILSPVQLLWVNLVTDGLPATALGFNPVDREIMHHEPRDSRSPIVDTWQLIRYLLVGSWVGVATVIGYTLYWREGVRKASTISLSILVLIEMFNAINSVSENESIFVKVPWKNPFLILAICCSLLLHAVIIYVPLCQGIMQVTELVAGDWWVVFWLSVPVLFLDELLKWISRRRREFGKLKRS